MNRFSFLSQQTDRQRLPVALLSGFLGSALIYGLDHYAWN